VTAPLVRAITNVTAFVGEDFEPRIADLRIAGDGTIEAIEAAPSIQRASGDGAKDESATNESANDESAMNESARDQGAFEIDGTGLFAFPGMIDCHDHFRNITPGLSLAQGLRLDEFLQVLWSTGAEMGPTEYRIGALLGSLQRLKTGITTVVDHCYTFHAPGLDEASLEGYEGSGARWLYARGIMTRPYEPVCESWETAEATIRRLVADGLVPPERLFVAPVSIRQATPEDLRRSRALADDLGVGTCTHVAETESELDMWKAEAGDTPIRALDAFGFLTERTLLIHCVLLDDGEIDLLRARGSHVVHCPTNHMKLAKGFTRVPDLLEAGVNVAMGVDMMADMLVEMRAEVGMHAANRLDPGAVTTLDAFRIATTNGARAIGWGDRTGLLEEGKLADLVVLDGRSLLQAPLLDPRYALLYATDPGMVRHVLVEGRLVVRDGRSVLVDEDALLTEAESVTNAYLARIGYAEGTWFTR
jgi:5-methylthioadenosine/S-adenosylhomocysteine deaminase